LLGLKPVKNRQPVHKIKLICFWAHKT